MCTLILYSRRAVASARGAGGGGHSLGPSFGLGSRRAFVGARSCSSSAAVWRAIATCRRRSIAASDREPRWVVLPGAAQRLGAGMAEPRHGLRYHVESFSAPLGPKGLIRSRFMSVPTRWIVCVRRACTHTLYCMPLHPFFRAGGSVTPNARTSNSRVLQSYPVIPRRRTMAL